MIPATVGLGLALIVCLALFADWAATKAGYPRPRDENGPLPDPESQREEMKK